MRDSREPTPPNAEGETPRETLAESVPRVFAARLRAARRASGVSQAAVADAMRYRGFNWRQTTVAKSEAADRPVLFAEAIALSQIFKKGLEYFLFEGTELDSVIDEASREMQSVAQALEEVEDNYLALKNDLELYRCVMAMGSAISRYQKAGDYQALANDVMRSFSRWGPTCVYGAEEVYESVGIDPGEVKRLDDQALIYVAKQEQEKASKLSEGDLLYESGERLLALSHFLEGKKVEGGFIATLRDGGEWASYMAGAVLDLLRARLRKTEAE